MLYLISGATAAGKSSVSRAVAARLPDLVPFEEDRRQATTTEERRTNLELWIEDALDLEAAGKDVVFGTQSPLGELLASPGATRLEGIAPCLLDAHDYVRMDRWMARGVHAEWPMTMDHFCWAAFHRLHARDPQYEQRVLVDQPSVGSVWSRWTSWTAEDPRWDVFVFDSSGTDFAGTVVAIADWIESVRRSAPSLTRDDEWWKERGRAEPSP